MPPYCAARLHKYPAEVDHWRNVLGPDYLHTHHFCYAIGFINRYYGAKSARSKTFNLQNAMGNLNYMIANASPTYSLMPDVYMYRGLVHSLTKKDGAAITDIRKAIELDPKLTRAYSMAADIYTKLNKKDEALKLATDGLRYNPDSAVLQRLYLKLGGKLPYPEPVAKQESAPPAAPAESKADDTAPDMAAENGPTQQPAPVAAPEPAIQDSEKAGSATPPDTQPIGSTSNPWCRFCPPEPDK